MQPADADTVADGSGLSGVRTGSGHRWTRAAWIESSAFDVFLLVLTPLTLLPLVIGFNYFPAVVVKVYFVLALAHYASSFVFYFWDENQAYQRGRWLAFFAGPALIVSAYLLLLSAGFLSVIFVVVVFWNTWHVARQNCGILSLYRSRAQVPDVDRRQKSAADNAIISVSIFLMLWNIDTNDDVVGLFAWVSPHLLVIVKTGVAAAALLFTAKLVVALIGRKAQLGVPEGLFIASSLAFFYPYLFAATSGQATTLMLLPHFVQYMALVWLLHRRKFGRAAAGVPVVVRRMSANIYLLVFVLFAVGAGFYVLNTIAYRVGHKEWANHFVLIIALTHFYIDGLNWSFRRAHVRQTMLPFLLPQQRQPG